MYVLAFTLFQSEDLHGVRSGDQGVHCSNTQNVSEQSYMVGESFLCPGRVALTEKAMLQTYFWQESKHFSKCFMAVVTSPCYLVTVHE
jgi:hypothetical protein